MKILLFFIIIFMTFLIYIAGCLKHQKLAAKAMNNFGQSKFVQYYSRLVQTKVDKFMSYGHEPASQQYQDFGLEAQQELGIDGRLQLPIKKTKDKSKLLAVVGSDGIYVNEKVFDTKSFGAKRYMMFHESVHAKYHDAAVLGMLKIIGFGTGCVGMYELLDLCGITMLAKTLSVVAGVVSSLGISFKYRQFMERRADTEGPWATECAECVQEEIALRTQRYTAVAEQAFNSMAEEKRKKALEEFEKRFPNTNFSEICEKGECFQGYLSREELAKIAQDLGDKNCKYHLNHQNL
jgi:hypothetical protein